MCLAIDFESIFLVVLVFFGFAVLICHAVLALKFLFTRVAGVYFLWMTFKSSDVTLLRLLFSSLSFSSALDFLKIITGLEVISISDLNY